MASSVPFAKANLLAIVTAAVPGTEVSYGWPGQLIQKEHVWIDDAVFDGEKPSLGQVSHREDYKVPVVVVVHADGDDHQEAEERAWELAAAIETYVLANPTLGGAQGVTAAYVTGKEPAGHIADAARAVSIAVEVTIKAKVPGDTGGPALDIALPLGPVQDEGAALTRRPALNFIGAGVTATDDPANDRTNVTIPRGVDIPRCQLSDGVVLGAGVTSPTASYVVRDGRVYFTGRLNVQGPQAPNIADGLAPLFTLPSEINSYATTQADVWCMALLYDAAAGKAIVSTLFPSGGQIFAQTGAYLQIPYVTAGLCGFYLDGLQWDLA